MKFAKVLLVLFVAAIAVIALTSVWFMRIAAKAGEGHAIDIFYVVTRPMYLLEIFVILALAVWICRRWAFL